MKRVLKQYDRGFKLEALRLPETSGKSANQIEKELGIGKGNLSRWRRDFAKEGEDALPGHGRLTPEQEELRRLRRELEIARQERDIQKTYRHLLGTKAVRFQFIDDHRELFSVTRMCKVLNVSPSGCYAWRKRPISARETANRELGQKIGAVYHDNDGVYGSPGIYRELKAQGVACSENRVARLMKLRRLRPKQVRSYKSTTKRNKKHRAAPNLLKRDFTADRPGHK
jgi:transposase-like protein